MRESFLDVLRCPSCGADRPFALEAAERSRGEVRAGRLRCGACGLERPVRDGIVDLLVDPPAFVAAEAAGLQRFGDVMRADGWDAERILALPDVDLPYWRGQAAALGLALAEVPFRPGERLLDVGSNTCWASSRFAREGLDVVALDIADDDLQGLRAADLHRDRHGIHFERLLSVMFAPALADASFDHVLCCEVLHHNGPAELRRTLRELHRILRPGGRLTVLNEPLRFPLRPKFDHGDEVAEFDGHEHVYFAHEYVRAARAAGFAVTLPRLRAALVAPIAPRPAAGSAPGRLAAARGAVRARPRARSLVRVARWSRFWWRHGIRGDAALTLHGVKAG